MRKLETDSLGDEVIVTAISYSDQGFVLVGFSEGSIALYHSDYSSPLSIWYNACSSSIISLKWCSIYFSDGKKKPSKDHFEAHSFEESRILSWLCEFYVIDKSLKFYIWNLNKEIHKQAHLINFSEKYDPDYNLPFGNICAIS